MSGLIVVVNPIFSDAGGHPACFTLRFMFACQHANRPVSWVNAVVGPCWRHVKERVFSYWMLLIYYIVLEGANFRPEAAARAWSRMKKRIANIPVLYTLYIIYIYICVLYSLTHLDTWMHWWFVELIFGPYWSSSKICHQNINSTTTQVVHGRI